MKISIQPRVPDQFASQKTTPYETTYLYTGFGRYNTVKQTLEVLEVMENGEYTYFSRPHKPAVFSRVYSTELVTVAEYSSSPKIWSETIGEDVYFFQENQDQQPSASMR